MQATDYFSRLRCCSIPAWCFFMQIIGGPFTHMDYMHTHACAVLRNSVSRWLKRLTYLAALD